MRVGTPGFLPERLEEARKARGLTRVALAEQMNNRSPTALSRWEKGGQSPDSEALDRLATVLGVPSDYFMKPLPKYGEAPRFFRSMTAVTQRARDRIEQRLKWLEGISYDLQEWIDLPDVDIPDLGKSDFSSLGREDIEDAAEQCRDQWGLGTAPIQDLILVLESAGAVVAFDTFDTDHIDGVSHWCLADNRPYMLLASDKQTCVRSRFDAAHELAHLVLHRHVDRSKLKNATQFKELERQAHRFAAAFLLPPDSFTRELHRPSLEAFRALKLRWKVAIGAMVMRCRDLDLIDQEESSRLWRGINARRWRRQEPYDDTLNVEEPRLLKRSFHLLLSEGGFSPLTLKAELRLAAGDVESLGGLPRGYLSQDWGQVTRLPAPRLKDSTKKSPQQRGGTVIPLKPRNKR